MRIILLAASAALATAPLAAQPAEEPSVASTETAPATLQPAIMAVPTANAVLRAGTPISLRMMEEVTTKRKAARVGQRFRMEVASPVEINGVVVIPVGSPAEGEITSVRNKGMWGKSGHLNARVLYVRVNGRQIRLSGTFDDKGKTGTAGVVGAVAFVPLAGFFLTGTSAVLPMGATIPAFIDEDVELAFKAAAPAPMEVPVQAPPMSVEAPAEAPASE